jgi:hypothetical protein
MHGSAPEVYSECSEANQNNANPAETPFYSSRRNDTIDLCLCYAMKKHKIVEVNLHTFLTVKRDAGEWSA